MQCANPECRRKKPTGFFGKMFNDIEGFVKGNKWYCDEHCYRHPILKDFLLRKQSGRELRTITYPVTSRAFGAALLKMEKISGYQLDRALVEKSGNGKLPLAHYLMKKNLISRRDVIEALGKHHRVPVAYLRSSGLAPNVVATVPGEIARVSGVVPLSYNPNTNRISLLMKDPSDLTTILTIRRLSGCEVTPFQGDPVEIDRLIAHYYPAEHEEIMPLSPASAAEYASA